jgi:hypothetical protein
VNINFTPLREFFSQEFKSYYLPGLIYTARPEDKKLLSLLPAWLSDGKVILGTPAAPLPGIVTTFAH